MRTLIDFAKIVESPHMTKTIEDWSRVRSPSRARRRMRYGHRQNIVYREVPRTDAITLDGGITFYMHPQAAKALNDALALQYDRLADQAMRGLLR